MRPYLLSIPPMRHNQSIPWLLFFSQNSNTNPKCSVLTFYDLSTAVYFSVRIPIRSLCKYHWLGSYKGWLVTLDQKLQLHLIKFLTCTHVLLPCKGIEKQHPKKVVMCHSLDNPNELQIFCLTEQGRLFSMKLGDESWTWEDNYDTYYKDIVVNQGKVYVVSVNFLCYWNIGSSSTEGKVIAYFTQEWTNYLLEWKGELVMMRIYNEERVSLENHTPEQVVLIEFKLRDRGVGVNSRHIKSLGYDALFFGANCSYAVSSSGRDDIRGNCIYFTNQMSRCIHDAETFNPNHIFGSFNFGEQTYYKPCYPQDSPMYWPPPIWFWPCYNNGIVFATDTVGIPSWILPLLIEKVPLCRYTLKDSHFLPSRILSHSYDEDLNSQ